jgi:hypothetical protein
MAKVAELDPAWVRGERRREFRFWASLAVAMIAIAGATWAVVVNKEQDTQITRIEPKVTKLEQTPCAKDPTGPECQTMRAEVERAASLYVTCIPIIKAGYLCPKPGSRAAERQKQVAVAGPPAPFTTQPGSSKSGSVRTAQPGNGGGTDGPSQPNAPSVPDQSSGSGGSPQGSPETSAPESPTGSSAGVLPEVVEAAGGAAGEAVAKTGEAAAGVIEGVTKTGCALSPNC